MVSSIIVKLCLLLLGWAWGGTVAHAAPLASPSCLAHAPAPVLVTTEAMFEQARKRIDDGDVTGSWKKIKDLSDEALSHPWRVYEGADHEEYWRAMRAAFILQRYLAVTFRLTNDRRYLDKAVELFVLLARNEKQYPFGGAEKPQSAGLVLGRALTIAVDTYTMLHHGMEPALKEAVNDWLRGFVKPILRSQEFWEKGTLPGFDPPWLGRQDFNNHLSAHALGLLVIGVALSDAELIRYALDSAQNPRNLRVLFEGAILGREDVLYHGDPTLIWGYPAHVPGEIYDRYRTRGHRGLHYSFLNLRLLTIAAIVCRNNGLADLFHSIPDKRGNLQQSYAFYGAFVATESVAERTGYYKEDDGVPRSRALYRLVASEFPNVPEISRLGASRKLEDDTETFGYSWDLLF